MKLLLDENLSHRLVGRLADLFPGSEHVSTAGLTMADDEAVWNHARRNGQMIATKDTDFHQRCFLFGPPPKVVWLRTGNCTTAHIESLLRSSIDDIRAFAADDEAALLVLG